ncbi:hypothetical protein CRG98_010214, partial [Punica granatum]
MGSTSAALVPHLQLNGCCFNRLDSVKTQVTSFRIDWSRRRRTELRLMSSKRLSSFACSAVEDDKQQELRSGDGGLGSAVEDRP